MKKNKISQHALREMEHNWNKSVNLSSKSVYSANKLIEKSARKDDKNLRKNQQNNERTSRSQLKDTALHYESMKNK